jgi:hypothetical protein
MAKTPGILLIGLCLALVSVSKAADTVGPALPDWQVLKFEEKAFWATARSRLEISQPPTTSRTGNSMS